jgi:hypothetical protein
LFFIGFFATLFYILEARFEGVDIDYNNIGSLFHLAFKMASGDKYDTLENSS